MVQNHSKSILGPSFWRFLGFLGSRTLCQPSSFGFFPGIWEGVLELGFDGNGQNTHFWSKRPIFIHFWPFLTILGSDWSGGPGSVSVFGLVGGVQEPAFDWKWPKNVFSSSIRFSIFGFETFGVGFGSDRWTWIWHTASIRPDSSKEPDMVPDTCFLRVLLADYFWNWCFSCFSHFLPLFCRF